MASTSPPSPISLVQTLLANTTNLPVLRDLVSPTATYISLNFSNPPLQRIMPWCGTHAPPSHGGPTAIHETFVNVARHWAVEDFAVQSIFGDNHPLEEGEGNGAGDGNVAVFGTMTLRGRVTGIAKTSPFAIWCRVDRKAGKVVFMQFMEDTFATAATFEKGGEKVYRADPEGGEEVL